MTYIDPNSRDALDEQIFDLAERIESPAQLTYAITKIAVVCAMDSPADEDTFNAIMGGFESAKQEFYRRVVAPFNDTQIAEHGDLFEGMPEIDVEFES